MELFLARELHKLQFKSTLSRQQSVVLDSIILYKYSRCDDRISFKNTNIV